MEMNAANVTQHKFFGGKPSFVDKKKKMDEKSRFGELSIEEIQEIVNNAIPVLNNKESSQWDYLTVHIS